MGELTSQRGDNRCLFSSNTLKVLHVITCLRSSTLVRVYFYAALGSLNHLVTSCSSAHVFHGLHSSHPPPLSSTTAVPPLPPINDPVFLHIFIFPTSLDRLAKLSSATISLNPAIHCPLIGSVSLPYVHIPIIHTCTCTHCACHLVSVLNRCSAVERDCRTACWWLWCRG